MEALREKPAKRARQSRAVEQGTPSRTVEKQLLWLHRLARKNKDALTTEPYFCHRAEKKREGEPELVLGKRSAEAYGYLREALEYRETLSQETLEKYTPKQILRRARELEANITEAELAEVRHGLENYETVKTGEMRTMRQREVFGKFGLKELTGTMVEEIHQEAEKMDPVALPKAEPRADQRRRQGDRRLQQDMKALGEFLGGKHGTLKESAIQNSVPYKRLLKTKQRVQSGATRLMLEGGTLHYRGGNRQYGRELDQFLVRQIHLHKGMVTCDLLRTAFQLSNPLARTPSRRTVGERLRRLGMTRKREAVCPPQRNELNNKVVRQAFMCHLLRAMTQGRLIVSIDETGINADVPARLHWAPRGRKLHCRAEVRRMENLTCLFATSPRQMLQVQYLEGGCTSLVFADFVKRLLEKLAAERELTGGRPPLLLMDNASIHRGALLTAVVEKVEAEILYTPSYSPMCNPVEFANGALKSWLRRRGGVPR